MLCWLELMILATGSAGGRSAKRAPLRTRALWAMEGSAMKTTGRVPTGRVMMGPYFATKLRSRDSMWRVDLRSHWILVRMGIEGGPGGSLEEVWTRVKMEVRREQMEKEMRRMNQISIFFVSWRMDVEFSQNNYPLGSTCQCLGLV